MSAPSSTRTTLFGIFVLAGRPLSAAQAIALSRPLGISSNNVKSHLTRMVAEGALRRSGPRRLAVYWPSPGKQNVVRGIAARLEGGPEEAWDGRWIVLTLRMPRSRSERSRVRNALWFDGFRPWDAATYLRPAWPAKWALDRAAAHLASRPGMCVCGVMLGMVDVTHVGRMYGLDSLDRHARRLAGAITIKPQRIRSDSAAFAARLDIGGRVARLVAHDPRLPPALWNRRTGLRDMVRAYQRFEARVAPRAQRFLDDTLRATGPGNKSAGASGCADVGPPCSEDSLGAVRCVEIRKGGYEETVPRVRGARSSRPDADGHRVRPDGGRGG